MAEIRAKKKLEELSTRWNGRISADQLLNVFKSSQQKYTVEKLASIAKQYVANHCTDGAKLVTQFETNVKKNQKTPYEAIIIMLNGATISLPHSNSQQPIKPQIPVKPSTLQCDSKITKTTDFESPALCSTRLEPRLETNNTPENIVVSEVWECIKFVIR